MIAAKLSVTRDVADKVTRYRMPSLDDPGSAPPGRILGNRLLASLPADELIGLLPHMERISLPPRRVLFEAFDDVTHVHFLGAGAVVSLIGAMQDGRSAEVGVVGCEGAIGGLISGGGKPASSTAIVQVGGPALRIEAARIEDARRGMPRLNALLLGFADALLALVMQSVACNALHDVQARACRRLLDLQDRTGGDELPMTQEHLAELLGVQRTTITRVIADLAAAGAIEPRRGRIVIASRAKLRAGACECHDVVKRHFECVVPGLYPVATPSIPAAGA